MAYAYSSAIRRRAAIAAGRGRLERPSHAVCWGDPERGPFLRLEVLVARGAIARAAFDANDCPVAIACGSALVELIDGEDAAALARLGRADLVALVGEVPPGKTYCLDMAAELLRQVAELAQPGEDEHDEPRAGAS